MQDRKPTNAEIASELDSIADLLDTREANVFRVRAYRQGALQVRRAKDPLADLVLEGREERLKDLPDIGEGLAGVIAEFVRTGRTGLHQDLLGEISPADVFRQVPGIGEKLADRVIESLGLSTLEELERAANDGRLSQVEGFGKRRLQMVRDVLAGMLSRSAARIPRNGGKGKDEKPDEPPVGLLLEIDTEYRDKANQGRLRTIAPKRFNPEGRSWLPVMNTQRKGWDFTVLYSNTHRAHELGKVRDWVVIYYDRDGAAGQVTVVTDTLGDLGKQRVVRGRERESFRYHASRVA
ncbi:MAG: helix-hairpin-helix domain-containing protein [Pseudomonadota bacterium]|mgnify:CR=1 FL=1|nr:helix-hairpin-helix domain-containing protein [Pseudomonadota bacterium]HON38996.1 helix-hairpin-helix domain-containing protein [Deltaproteobacteria bacterium]HPD22089.1 helix-hairpin-helix domain-containing protein [Deltaproteobacteria bacterium]